MKATIISAILAVAVTAQPPPPKSCAPGRNICGFELRGPPFNYAQPTLEAIIRASGQPATDVNLDGLFKCNATSQPEFFHPCLNNQNPPRNATGSCDPQGINGALDAVCRNGPKP